jgi:hypothetical protein
VLGNAAVGQEISNKVDFGQKLKQQRMANAQAYVQGTPLNAQYQNMSAAQNQAAPFMPASYAPGANLNPNAGAQGASFAMQSYGQQSQNTMTSNRLALDSWNADVNQPNPWMEGIGMAIGAASTGASMAMM